MASVASSASTTLRERLERAARVASDAFASYAQKHGSASDPFCDLASPLALPEEEAVIDLFKEDLGTLLTEGSHSRFPEVVGDISLLRLLRGREYDPEDCLRTFRSHIEKRRLHKMDAIRDRISSSEDLPSLATKEDPHAYHMTDIVHGDTAFKYTPCNPNAGYSPNGHCIILTPLGCHNTRGMVKALVAEEDGKGQEEKKSWGDKYLEYVCEELVRRQMQMDNLSRQQGRLVKMINIINCEGISMWHLSHAEVLRFSKRIKNILQTWPEGMARVITINTPWIVNNFYNGFFQFLFPKRSRRKFHMYGFDYREKLLDRISPATLAQLLQMNHEYGLSSGASDSDAAGDGELNNSGSLRNRNTEEILELAAGKDKDILVHVDAAKVQCLTWCVEALTRDIVCGARLYTDRINYASLGETTKGQEGAAVDGVGDGNNALGSVTKPQSLRRASSGTETIVLVPEYKLNLSDGKATRIFQWPSEGGTGDAGKCDHSGAAAPSIETAADSTPAPVGHEVNEKVLKGTQLAKELSATGNEIQVHHSGLLVLNFSNKHSWMRSNKVKYSIGIIPRS